MRQIILDTETTGLEPEQGHRIIEIGCVEMVNRRLTGNNYHQYLQPDREIDQGAIKVHGITNEFLADKPRFHDIVEAFLSYIKDAELIIHNAPFDVGFLNHELNKLDGDYPDIKDYCQITDTLVMARAKHPGQRNSLDALCKRYEVSNAHRDLHGALLDSEILADVYRAMTGGQGKLFDDENDPQNSSLHASTSIRRLDTSRPKLRVLRATETEIKAHEARLKAMEEKIDGSCVWNTA